MWRLNEDAVESIAIGAGILGTGGGGNPYLGQLRAKQLIREHGPLPVVSPDELDEDARVVCVGGLGAPTIGVEKIRDLQSYHAFRALESYTGESATAIIPNEIGGSNSLEAIVPASIAGLPIVDADGMGRAFPQYDMKTFFVYGAPYVPVAICDEKGNTVIISEAVSAKAVEHMARAVTIRMGCISGYAVAHMSAERVRTTAIPHTLSLARTLGEAVRRAQQENEDPIQAILGVCPGRVLFEGKIIDVERRTAAGFARGSVTIDGTGDRGGSQMTIEFQNENLIATEDDDTVCTVPDLICIVDSERGEPITTELLRYGFRVTVLGLPAPGLWTTPQGLDVVGPRSFGYELDYRPLIASE